MDIDWTAIWQTLGGLALLALTIFVGLIFFKRESNMGADYGQLMEQYRTRNEELVGEVEGLKDKVEMLVGEVTKLQSLVSTLTAQNRMLTNRLAELTGEVRSEQIELHEYLENLAEYDG